MREVNKSINYNKSKYILTECATGCLTVNEIRLGLELGTTQEEMCKLWEDHITWTRLYVVSAGGRLAEERRNHAAPAREPS
jgi:hypothetical protein